MSDNVVSLVDRLDPRAGHHVRDAINNAGIPASLVIERVARALQCPRCGAWTSMCRTTKGHPLKSGGIHDARWRRAVRVLEGDERA